MTTRRDIHATSDARGVIVDEHVEPEIAVHQDASADEHEVATFRASGWSLTRAWLGTFNALVAFVLLVVEALLSFRLVFALAGANPANGFVNFIYDLTGPLVAPFENIANERVDGSSVFEPETVIAMGVYAVAALLVMAFVNIIASTPSPVETESVSRTRHAHYDHEV